MVKTTNTIVAIVMDVKKFLKVVPNTLEETEI
jgi:hypothetical protein